MKKLFFILSTLSQLISSHAFSQIDTTSTLQPLVEKENSLSSDDIYIERDINLYASGSPIYTTCEGDSIEIIVVFPLSPVDNFRIDSCETIKYDTLIGNNSLKVSGINYFNIRKWNCGDGEYTKFDWFYCAITLKIAPKVTTTFRIEWLRRNYYDRPYRTCSFEVYNYTEIIKFYGDITVNVRPKPPTPTIAHKTIISPNYNDGSKTIELNVNGCNDGNIKWNNSFVFGKKSVVYDPFLCYEYRAACEKDGCISDSSNIVDPAKEFRPSDHGYKQVFRDHIQNQINASTNWAEQLYRSQYNCVLNGAINQSWGQEFVKYNFDYVAKNNPCEKSFQLEGDDDSFYIPFLKFAYDHYFDELLPAFSGYIFNVNNCNSFEKIRSDHKFFLINSVAPCFDQRINTPGLSYLQKAFLRNIKLSTIGYMSYTRETFIFQRMSFLRCYPEQNVVQAATPPIFSKSEMYDTAFDTLGELIVHAEIDTTYFVGVNSSIQLRVLKKQPDGSYSDITHSSSGTEYTLYIDSAYVDISPNGLMHIKKMDSPFSNRRMPFLVEANNGSDLGFGQFAIYDGDSDDDFISNSAEVRLGTNPLVYNDIYTDTDGDQLADFQEIIYQTSIDNSDTDSDGFSDYEEVNYGSDPKDPSSYPITIYSVESGRWDTEQTWSCYCIPSQSDPVQINENHTVTVPDNFTANANSLHLKGKLDMKVGAALSLPNN